MTPDFSPKLQTFLQGIRGPNGRPLKWETHPTVRVALPVSSARWWRLVCPVGMKANIVLKPERANDWRTGAAVEANDVARLGLTGAEVDSLMCAADDPFHPLRPAMLRHLGVA